MPKDAQNIIQASLVDLCLDAVALCNQGANSRANIVLNKRREQTHMPSTFEELLKSLNTDHASIVNTHIAAIEADKDGIIKGLQEKVATLEKAATPVTIEADVIKTLPDDVQKKFTDMQATIDTLVTKQAEELANKRFEKCKALPVEATELKDVLKTASPAVVAILEKASQALAESAHTPVGVETTGQFKTGGAEAQYDALEKAARKIMSENDKLTFEQAFTKAIELNPDVYIKYAEGVK